jgi:flavorubredoxin
LEGLKVRDDIYWVGSLDFDIKVFDIIMHTENGTTYNAYVVKGTKKNVLFEVSKEAFFDEFYSRLSSVIDPAQIDYIVLDHTEPDHTGSLSKLLPHCPKAIVVATNTAMNFVKEILNNDSFHRQVVKDGDTIDIGGKTLRFIQAPFLHWPDTMFTYIPECKTLFTCDAFGCHYADEKVFNDQIHGDFYDAYKYYFDNILGPFRRYVLDALDKINDLDIETVCNGHGPVLRTNVQHYFDLYREWATPAKKDKNSVVIAYVSAYGYTRKMAQAIAEGVKAVNGTEVKLYDFVYDDVPEAMRAIDAADGLLLGCPTLVGDALPPIYNILTHLNPQYNRGKVLGVFGSYGWSGEAVPNLEGRIKQLKFKMPLNGLRVKFKPNEDDLEACVEFGKRFAESI